MGIQRTCLNIIKAIYDNPTANITFNSKKLKVFSSKIRNKTMIATFTNIVLEVLPTAIRQGKERKCVQIKKEELKLSLFADDMIFYIQITLKTLPETVRIYEVSKLLVTKSIYKNLLHFYTLITNYQNEKLRKQYHLQLHQKE